MRARIPLKKMHLRFHRRRLAGRVFSSWSLFVIITIALMLIAAIMAYYASTLSSTWRVLEETQGTHSSKIYVTVDAEHVLYVGDERQIVPLDAVEEAVLAHIRQLREQGVEDPVLILRIAGSVKANILLPLIFTLSRFPLHLTVWEEDAA